VPNPPEVTASFSALEAESTVYNVMNGPNEFYVIGTLKDWTIVDRVDRIVAPTLLISGRYDEATPATVHPFADRIPDVRWEIFENSSHMPHVEEEEAYLRLVGGFLAEHD
jgi:L-proline amide hydrolase